MSPCIFFLTAYEARQTTKSENSYVLLPPPMMTRHQGRPRYSLSGEQISHLVSLGMNWQSIATCLGVSCWTLCRHRHMQHCQMGTWTELLLKFFSLPRMQGNDMCMGVWGHGYAFKGAGLDSLQEIDPIGRSYRRRCAIRRRIYSVPTPNQLWWVNSQWNNLG